MKQRFKTKTVTQSIVMLTALLSRAKKYADSHPEQPRLITINAWNKCVEGSYLLPDMRNGLGYPEAVKRVILEDYDPYTK